MSPKAICLLALLVACAYPAAAGTYYVGSCKSGSFATIGAAVEAAPAGSTIAICAGGYSEQVIISKDLTLTGLDSSTEAGAYIQVPGSMLTTTSPIKALAGYGPLAPVIWVTGGTVNIQNVFVNVAVGNSACPPRTVGFYYTTGASGTLNHVGFVGEGCGVGIWVENDSYTPTSVTIENSLSNQGIFAGSLPVTNGTMTVTIRNNQVFPISPEGFYGIYLYSVSGTVEGNFISGPRWSYTQSPGLSALLPLPGRAIYNDGVTQTDVTISGNTIQVSNDVNDDDTAFLGIGTAVDGTTIKANKISGAYIGVELNCLAPTVSGNTISNVIFGLSDVPAGFTGANTFFNTNTKALDCP
jgi:hypothetical protein